MNATKDWYEINDTDSVDSPALLIYVQRVKENIQTLISMIDDPSRLRPHIKTHKTKEAVQLCMDAGILKFKCATIAEAEGAAPETRQAARPDVLHAAHRLERRAAFR